MLGHTYRINENECEFLNRSARFTSFLMVLSPPSVAWTAVALVDISIYMLTD